MRLSPKYKARIKEVVEEIAGSDARVFLFGSRVDDDKAGGDVDLLVELPSDVHDPAVFSEPLAAQISRIMSGRKTDVIISAPNLKSPIEDP